jgi:hypothetical protein
MRLVYNMRLLTNYQIKDLTNINLWRKYLGAGWTMLAWADGTAFSLTSLVLPAFSCHQAKSYAKPNQRFPYLFHILNPVLRMRFWYGSGSADPYLWQTDPDPTPTLAPDPVIFVSDLYIIFQRWKVIKKSQHSRNQVFLIIFAWWKKNLEPDPYLVLMDPAPDPGDPKHTYPAPEQCLNPLIIRHVPDPDPAFCLIQTLPSHYPQNLIFPFFSFSPFLS